MEKRIEYKLPMHMASQNIIYDDGSHIASVLQKELWHFLRLGDEIIAHNLLGTYLQALGSH